MAARYTWVMPSPAARLGAIPPYLFAEISRIKADAIAAGADVIDLGIGDPDLPTPTPIIEALAKAAQDPATHRYDESPHGWRPFLEAAAEFYEREFGVRLDPTKQLGQLIGSKEGLAHLAWAYVGPGDVAIVPNPGYTVYKVNALMAGGEVYETPLRAESGFLPRLEDIPSEVASKAKLFYVCYPHNPTGAVANRAFFEDLVRFCREHDILLVSDMAYATVAYDGFQNPTALQIKGASDVTIEFHSLSKTYNMTGWRLGFTVGNPEATATLQRLKSNLDSKAFPAVAEAGAFALRNLDNRAAVQIYQRRRDLLCAGLNDIGWPVEPPKASFYVWARIPRSDMTSAEFAAEMLKRANIVMIPGTGYGSEGEGYVRMSLTLQGDRDGERFAEVVTRIRDAGLIPTPAHRGA